MTFTASPHVPQALVLRMVASGAAPLLKSNHQHNSFAMFIALEETNLTNHIYTFEKRLPSSSIIRKSFLQFQLPADPFGKYAILQGPKIFSLITHVKNLPQPTMHMQTSPL